ncbi:DUF4097 family beta strand repeat-containing protein [Clostridium sp. C2-6-12]|uniref:DUF4097 family beta strand repeat-containing protein n=1 Tax=Clostridium sp. C2-6-12 TaxID=2698832 RepID=UPI00136E884E|nr:DUF4097 family beta strand repeat-containing protein [Clostridium sp. C2-6-12]
MAKKFISTKMKMLMLILLLLSITFYASGCIALIQSGYKLSDYPNELNISPDSFKFNGNINLFDFDGSSLSKEYNLNDNINEISINLNSQDIKIENYEGQTLKVQVKSGNSASSELTETEEGHKLSLNTSYNTPGNAKISLSIPNSFKSKGDLKIVTSSGDINVSNVSLDTLSVSTASGDTEASNLTLNYFSLNSSSGDTHLKNVSVSNESKLVSSSGEIVGNGTLGQLTANTTSGDMELKLEKSLANSSLRSISGSINLSLPKDSGYKINYDTISGRLESSNGKMSHGDESSIININTTSGNLNIR